MNVGSHQRKVRIRRTRMTDKQIEDGTLKKIADEWFMFLEDFDVCENCETEFERNRWINVDKAIKQATLSAQADTTKKIILIIDEALHQLHDEPEEQVTKSYERERELREWLFGHGVDMDVLLDLMFHAKQAAQIGMLLSVKEGIKQELSSVPEKEKEE